VARSALRHGPGRHLYGRPSRLAYRWIRGAAGWSKSPIAEHTYNDSIPDCELDDDVPGHLLAKPSTPQRIWSQKNSICKEVLADQADTEREADQWAALWKENDAYSEACDPMGTPALAPLLPWAIKQAAGTFPVGTGLGADNVAPRAYARLSVQLLRALCAIMMALELNGSWPTLVQLVIIVLLPKPDGGRRPIGLFVSLIRVWARARSIAARAWEAANPRPGLYGSAGMGAQRAAWQDAFAAESATLKGETFSHSLLDLVKAFEAVQHWTLVRAAHKHGYNVWLLRLSLQAYRIRRTICVEACFSRCVTATRGITAGSCFATSELRLLLLDIIDDTFTIWKTIEFSLYVDDATLSASGSQVYAAAVVAGATDFVVRRLEEDLKLEVSTTKSIAAASKFSVAELTAYFSVTGKYKPARAAKMLGTPSGGGKRRSVKHSTVRIRKFAKRTRRIKTLRKLGVKVRQMVRAAGTPGHHLRMRHHGLLRFASHDRQTCHCHRGCARIRWQRPQPRALCLGLGRRLA